MTESTEDEDSEEQDISLGGEPFPDTLSCPDGQVHFGIDAQEFLAHWVGKLGMELTGSALLVGESLSLAIVHPETGEVLTPKEIATRAQKARLTRVQ